MGKIHPIVGDAQELEEIAQFLSSFVADGELEDPLQGDELPETWRRRMDWWWTRNPFCGESSQRGFLLRSDSGEIVGFHGLIPFDYECQGESIPGLISCLFFVRETHRAESMRLFLQIQRLTRDFHLVDGGPTDPVVQILKRFSYQQGIRRDFYFYPFHLLGRKRSVEPSLEVTTDPGRIRSVPSIADDKLRRSVTPESLRWLSDVGRQERIFFGACDEEGQLVAYAIGMLKNLPGPFVGCQVIDYGSFDDTRCGVRDLLDHVVSHRRELKLPSKLALLIWGIENGATPPRNRIRLRRESKVFHCGPKSRDCGEKVVLPIEGDFCFF